MNQIINPATSISKPDLLTFNSYLGISLKHSPFDCCSENPHSFLHLIFTSTSYFHIFLYSWWLQCIICTPNPGNKLLKDCVASSIKQWILFKSTICDISLSFNSVLWKKEIMAHRIKAWLWIPGISTVREVGSWTYLLPCCTCSPSTAGWWPSNIQGPHFGALFGEGLISDLPEVRCSPWAKKEARNMLWHPTKSPKTLLSRGGVRYFTLQNRIMCITEVWFGLNQRSEQAITNESFLSLL